MSGYGTSPFQSAAQVAAAVGLSRTGNGTIPAGNTVTSTTETAFLPKMTIPAGTLVPGSFIRLLQWGLYSSSGLTPSITPRVRLGGVSLLPARAITGLLGTANSPWQAESTLLVTDAGIVGTALLTIDDNTVRIFGGPPVAPPSFAQALDLTSSAQWSGTGNSITVQGWLAEVLKPAP